MTTVCPTSTQKLKNRIYIRVWRSWERGWFGSVACTIRVQRSRSPESLETRAFAGFYWSAKPGRKTALTTGLTTDRKIFDFRPRRGIITQTLISGCSAVGSARDLGSRGRAFESPHSDQKTSEIRRFQRFLLIPCLLRRRI